ncbi:hypothetical protein TraAM80_03256 [Trypanosoma rangeli]|uniref:PH domain-containing protein n=1 Tax=Trypanosoma rangeli TaxID=5698 RepID=A0A422NQ13_TRYRA|nr:uncharacterized protein TraAM80_03256 [Trypanosoma rangeli]RNF07573.1 hypothetical protein TraAM80_03256 [Trypanosoma rangeli]|eukprot:RNF07573.1 hypothetical protein TraAM80_03256 [Trypanosoma rangeli]
MHAEIGVTPLEAPADREADAANGLHHTLPTPLLRGSDLTRRQSSVEVRTPSMDEVVTAESIKQEVEGSIGFASALDRQRWEEAWLGNLPLSICLRHWGNAMVHAGAGYKLSNMGGVLQRWVLRYFVLAWSLLYVFDSDSPKERCRGAVYLHHANVQKKVVGGRHAIVITPVTQKKPAELGMETFTSFTMSVDAHQLLGVWLVALQKTSAAHSSPGSPRPKAPQQMNTACISLTPTKSARPLQQPVRVAATPEVQLDAVGAVGASADAASDAIEIMVTNGFDDPSRSQMDIRMGEAGAVGNVEQRHLPGQRPQLTATAIGAASTASGDRETIIEAYRQQLQHLTVSAFSVKTRLRRIAEKKDRQHLGELLLQFVLSHINDAAALWTLIGQVEELPDVTAQTFTTTLTMSPLCCGDKRQLLPSDTPPDYDASNETAIQDAAWHTPPNSVRQHLSSIEKIGVGKEKNWVGTSPPSLTQSDAMGSHSVASPPRTVDAEWRQRMRRLQERRSVIENILSKLPSIS